MDESKRIIYTLSGDQAKEIKDMIQGFETFVDVFTSHNKPTPENKKYLEAEHDRFHSNLWKRLRELEPRIETDKWVYRHTDPEEFSESSNIFTIEQSLYPKQLPSNLVRDLPLEGEQLEKVKALHDKYDKIADGLHPFELLFGGKRDELRQIKQQMWDLIAEYLPITREYSCKLDIKSHKIQIVECNEFV